MPELPEVETIRRTLATAVAGRKVRRVRVFRRDVIQGPKRLVDLLHGARIVRIDRHGKQLALHGIAGNQTPCLCIHLGMSGSLRFLPAGQSRAAAPRRHVHLSWHLDHGRFLFCDPRRFGGVWSFSSASELWQQRWRHLGPDALHIKPRHLFNSLQQTKRRIKAALLDQHVVAGLGNIYVDELLFASRIHPLTACPAISKQQIIGLIRRLRRLLDRAITNGGSTLRNYVDADGEAGWFQKWHRVYGRAGQPCYVCGTILTAITVSARTTVFCPHCQGRLGMLN